MVGRTLAHYQILEKLGEGGMGEVYRAADTRLGREVAIKVLPGKLADDPERRRRFELEARAVASLKHPNIITIHSVEEQEGVHFITMELIDGQPLTQLIPEGGVELSHLFELAIPAADALSSAHAKGIAHRDLKPANLMLDSDGRVKVLDFGLAKLLATPAPESGTATQTASVTRTAEGKILGTAAYMSPEQAEGKTVDVRSDIFSFGIVLYEMATGNRPFDGDSAMATLSAILKDSPPRVSDLKSTLPRHLGRIIERCLEKDPDKRFQTARDVANELEGLKKEIDSGHMQGGFGPDAAAEPPSTAGSPETAGVRASRGVRWLAVVAAATVVVVAGAWWVLRDVGPATPAGDRPSREMIAVLPFDNLGPAEDAYFAAGISDEIIGRLAAVRGLGVISRTSVTQYDRTGKTLRQIGEDLGVTFVLEGTVRWARSTDGPGRVRITPQLVRVADDSPMWAETYDRQIDDIFEVQSNIAGQVIDQLGITLMGGEREAIDERPTDNLEAYQAYLKANESVPGMTVQDRDRWKVKHLERATHLDPGFQKAWSELSMHHSFYYREEESGMRYDPTPRRLDSARQAMERALAIDATHPSARLARGHYHYSGFRDYDRAVEDFAAVVAAVPNDAGARVSIALIYRRQGRWDEALAELAAAAALAPRDADFLHHLAVTYRATRDFDRAIEVRRRVAELDPDNIQNQRELALDTVLQTGDLSRGLELWRQVPASQDFFYFRGWIDLSTWARDFDQAYDWARQMPSNVAFMQALRVTYMAQSRASRDGGETARMALESLTQWLESFLAWTPDLLEARRWLGLTYARLGDGEAAIREGRRAVEQAAADRAEGPWAEENLAKIYAELGRADEAMDLIERLLETPYFESLTVTALRLDPAWDNIRDDDRFRELVQG